MKISKIFFSFLFVPSLLTAGWHDRKAEGWAWYEDRKEEQTKTEQPKKEIALTSSSEEIQKIRQELEEKLSRAILNPTNENILAYMQEQKKWIDLSANFASVWSHLLLDNPRLDETVTGRPVSQYGLQLHKAQLIDKREELIRSLAQDHGLMFFYEGKNPVSFPVGEVVQEFCSKYEWTAMNISVDGEMLDLPHNTINNGICEKMGINVFPALVVIDPKGDTVIPIAFGLFSADKIEENLVFQFQETDVKN